MFESIVVPLPPLPKRWGEVFDNRKRDRDKDEAEGSRKEHATDDDSTKDASRGGSSTCCRP